MQCIIQAKFCSIFHRVKAFLPLAFSVSDRYSFSRDWKLQNKWALNICISRRKANENSRRKNWKHWYRAVSRSQNVIIIRIRHFLSSFLLSFSFFSLNYTASFLEWCKEKGRTAQAHTQCMCICVYFTRHRHIGNRFSCMNLIVWFVMLLFL